jgi:RNA polymerase sigma-70 factor (ECF subfamily)
MTSNPQFATDTEQFRRELLAHCYRLIGSLDEAEDLVQETYLRAWRSYAGFEGRSSVRVWLYRIATNVCLSALNNRSRRVLPSGLGAPTDDPESPTPETGPEVDWLDPFPDTLADPATIVADRDGLRLALIASLQYLPGRQRAVLILRDVLAFSASEVAEILDTSVAAVKSALQRARGRLQEVAPSAETLAEPTEPAVQALLAAYIAAFEHADPALLTEVLRKDAAIEVIGTGTWFAGKTTCLGYLARVTGAPGDWRMLPTSVNGQPAAIAYVRDGEGVLRAFGIGLLTTTATHITRITAFGDPALVGKAGFPMTYESIMDTQEPAGTAP